MDDFIGGNNYNQTEEQKKVKKWMKLIGIILMLLLIASICMIIYIYYLQSEQLKISIDGSKNSKATNPLKNEIIFENGQIYVPIRDFASYVNYDSSNGIYKQYSEDITTCHVKNENEVASFTLNSNKISKLSLLTNEIETFEIDSPVIIQNGKLYTTMEGASIAFNISMSYDEKSNKITIYTLPYLAMTYSGQYQNSAILEGNNAFNNQKALLYGMIVIKNAENNYGVYNFSNQTEVLGTKYSDIEFVESSKEFIVTTQENKKGIMLSNSTTKITPQYDSIKLIDKTNDLYLVENNSKQGVINGNESIIIYAEYDKIGIDSTSYDDNIENYYVLYNKCIPVCKNNKWDLFDKTGKKISKVQYDDLGCSVGAQSNDKEAGAVLLIPKYEAIVVKLGNFYGIIDAKGNELMQPVLQSVYSIKTREEITYNMVYEDRVFDVIAYIRRMGNK